MQIVSHVFPNYFQLDRTMRCVGVFDGGANRQIFDAPYYFRAAPVRKRKYSEKKGLTISRQPPSTALFRFYFQSFGSANFDASTGTFG